MKAVRLLIGVIALVLVVVGAILVPHSGAPSVIGSEVEPDAQPTFGAAVRAKLAEVGASSERVDRHTRRDVRVRPVP